jgi:hypothetical protein
MFLMCARGLSLIRNIFHKYFLQFWKGPFKPTHFFRCTVLSLWNLILLLYIHACACTHVCVHTPHSHTWHMDSHALMYVQTHTICTAYTFTCTHTFTHSIWYTLASANIYMYIYILHTHSHTLMYVHTYTIIKHTFTCKYVCTYNTHMFMHTYMCTHPYHMGASKHV